MLEIRGLDRVDTNRRRVRDAWPREGRRILDEVGQPVLTAGRARARVDTGRMRASIQQLTTVDTTEIFSPVDYARFQHYGTVYVDPNPFLTGPLHELEPAIIRNFDQLLWQYIDRVWVDS